MALKPSAGVTKAIAGNSPTGSDCRTSPEFKELSDSFGASPGATVGKTDWKKVVTLANDILEKQSKDMVVIFDPTVLDKMLHLV